MISRLTVTSVIRSPRYYADIGNSDSSLRSGAGAGLRGDGKSSIAIATKALRFTKGGTGGTCPGLVVLAEAGLP